jgi:Tol biopolymer transport system component
VDFKEEGMALSRCRTSSRELGKAGMAWLGVALLGCAVPGWCAVSPTVFAPGVISGPSNDSDPCFSPDGNTVVFARNTTLMISHKRGAIWSPPEILPFSGQWPDQQPTMAPDGSFLVFVSGRPLNAGDTKRPAGNLWRVARHGITWGQPVHLPATVNRGLSTWAPSIAGDGSIYFIEKENEKTPMRLWRAQAREGGYDAAVPVSFGDTTTQDVDPAVAPDESFIVFGSLRPGVDSHERLFISFKENGKWGKPTDLGDEINGPDDTNEARLSPDGKTLYFSSDRNLPITYPRTRIQAAADQKRIDAWDNGNLNIWSVPLKSWLDVHLPN